MRKVCFVLIILMVLIPGMVLSSDDSIHFLADEVQALVQQEKELDGFTLLIADEDITGFALNAIMTLKHGLDGRMQRE